MHRKRSHSALVIKRQTNIVQHLLRNGTGYNLHTKDRNTPIHFASKKGHDSIAQLSQEN